jgi:hypothetical protein
MAFLMNKILYFLKKIQLFKKNKMRFIKILFLIYLIFLFFFNEKKY